jgi:hypothetical protein
MFNCFQKKNLRKKYMKENILLEAKYMSKIFIKNCKDEVIHHHFITYYSPQQNKMVLWKIKHV